MEWRNVVRAWQQGRAVIGMGLFCSLLTCAAGTAFNALLDGRPESIDATEFVRRLVVGYAASAMVVVLALPLLPAVLRRRSSGHRQ